jgi:GABA(A) receptor-associated protein
MASFFPSRSNSHVSSYKKNNSLEKLKEESKRILAKYPDRIPVIVEKYSGVADSLSELDKCKYLTPNDLTVGQFMFVIRKRLKKKIRAEEALYLFVNNTIPLPSMMMSQLYKEHKDETGFLFLVYSSESTFGVNVNE